MNKLSKIIIGSIGLCIATFICDKFLNIEANPSHLFFMIGGLVTGILISNK
jgi:hypothetical protein